MGYVHYLKVTDPETGDANITVFVSGAEKPYTAHNSHPNFAKIEQKALAGDPTVVELFDVAETAKSYFEPLSERVTVSGGHIYFDGDEVDNALTRQVVRFLEEDVTDWMPLVDFFENVQANPEQHSREQLYEWLSRRNFTITEGGNFIAYKGVRKREDHDDGFAYESINAGPGIVDGEAHNGHLPQSVGSVVELGRSQVAHDPAVGCARGLHVGSYDYAKGWARGVLLKVEVNPRDVVSVPTDCDAQKVRVCRYRVLEVIDAPVTAAIDYHDDEDADDDADDEGDLVRGLRRLI